jgi:hypothetical protein
MISETELELQQIQYFASFTAISQMSWVPAEHYFPIRLPWGQTVIFSTHIHPLFPLNTK